MIERIARAKINLALHVTGLREDNYHLLDSVVVFSEFGDHVKLASGNPDKPITLTVSGPFGEGLPVGSDNLVTRAAELLRQRMISELDVDPKPVSIHLTKYLPVASGIGGGSCDAAAALSALQAFWNGNLDLMPIASQLGADVAMCLSSKPLLAQGVGDEITLLDDAPELNLLLVNPGIAVSTPDVFGRLENKNNPVIPNLEEKRFPSLSQLAGMRNDLQKPAIALAAEISETLSSLEQHRPQIARMSGSGATCFGIFETMEEAEIARQKITAAFPDWWCIATRSTVS